MKSKTGDYSIGSDVWPGTSKVLEEMGELQQVLGKLIGNHGDQIHYDGSDIRKRLIEEIGDLLAAIHFFRAKNLSEQENEEIQKRLDNKLELFMTWHRQEK